MGKNNGSPKKSRVPFIIGIAMIFAVIGLMVAQENSEENSSFFLFCGIGIVICGFAAAFIYSGVKSAKRRKLMGEEVPKKTAADIAMWIFAAIGGVGLIALLWSLILSDEINYLAIFAELAVFILGFSVTYNIFMKKKKPELTDNENESEGDSK